MSDHPDFIEVATSQSERVEANRADVLVAVTGASLFSGQMALQKAREVAELVAALAAVGIEAGQIKVESVRAQNFSGTFSKTSTVSYALRLENVALERIADAIGAITGAKNATLGHLEWRFADETPLRDKMRAACLQAAMQRAQGIAQTLGVVLLGVYELSEVWQGASDDTSAPRGEPDWMSQGKAKMARVSEEELGLKISHAEKVKLELTIRFRVSEFK